MIKIFIKYLNKNIHFEEKFDTLRDTDIKGEKNGKTRL